MAGLGAVFQLGESLVGMLTARRDLLAAEGKLGALTAQFPIAQVPLSRLAAGGTPPTGLSLTCTRIAMSDYPAQRIQGRDLASGASLALDVSYLAAVWTGTNNDDQTILAWTMLELASHPVLDRSILGGGATWEPQETVQIVPETLTDDGLYRLWGALQQKLRLSTTFRARVVRIAHGPGEAWPNVVATRFGVANVDDALVESVP